MLKFIKDHMATIEGIEVYPILSLSIFFLFFMALFWWVVKTSKEHIKEMRELPLDKDLS